MKKYIVLISMVLLFSSYDKKPVIVNDLEMIYILNSDIDYQIIQITDNINDKLYNHKELITDKFLKYDSLTTQYVKAIDAIVKDLMPTEAEFKPSVLKNSDRSNAYFFSGEDYKESAFEFINKTNAYRDAVTALSDNYFTRSRLQLTLNTKSINLASGTKMKHLNYYLKDVTLFGAIVYLKNHKRKVLEYENYFLYDCILEKSKN